MRKFTKYPSNYVKAATYCELSDAEFDKLVDSYKGERSWSLIVAELKGTYGLDMAKKVADAVIDANSSSIEASTDYTSTRPLKVDCPRGPYYIWEEFGTFKGSVNNPDTFISDARRIHTFDGFNSLDEVVDYVKKYF